MQILNIGGKIKTEGKYIKNFVEEKENNDVKTFYHFFFREVSTFRNVPVGFVFTMLRPCLSFEVNTRRLLLTLL